MKLLKTISVFALAFLVLISSSSFTVGIHLCAGKIQGMAFFSQAEKCAMEQKLPPCHKPMADPCCDDATIVHEGDGFEGSFASITISAAPALDCDVPLVIVAEVIPDTPFSKISYRSYDPPLRSFDLTVTHQVFLI
jgi:hypothetical protein